jgi:hypothetical protein
MTVTVTDRLELTVPANASPEIARVVVENADGTRAIFFLTLTTNGHNKPTLEVTAKKTGGGETKGKAAGDWMTPARHGV